MRLMVKYCDGGRYVILSSVIGSLAIITSRRCCLEYRIPRGKVELSTKPPKIDIKSNVLSGVHNQLHVCQQVCTLPKNSHESWKV